MIDFVERIADAMATGNRGVGFITIDAGAGPPVFSQQVALPFKVALIRVYWEFAQPVSSMALSLWDPGSSAFRRRRCSHSVSGAE